MTTLDSDCGSQGNLLSQSTKKNGADIVPFFLKSLSREQECEIRELLERHFNAVEIAARTMSDLSKVEKFLATL